VGWRADADRDAQAPGEYSVYPRVYWWVQSVRWARLLEEGWDGMGPSGSRPSHVARTCACSVASVRAYLLVYHRATAILGAQGGMRLDNSALVRYAEMSRSSSIENTSALGSMLKAVQEQVDAANQV
jgi:hypothetical protein